jgi:hypothetical protein
VPWIPQGLDSEICQMSPVDCALVIRFAVHFASFVILNSERDFQPCDVCASDQFQFLQFSRKILKRTGKLRIGSLSLTLVYGNIYRPSPIHRGIWKRFCLYPVENREMGGRGYLDSQSVARQLGSLKFPVRNGSGNAASPGEHLRTGPDEQKKIQSA